MAYRVKCPECNGCMSPMHKVTTRYLFCGFCRQYYVGRPGELSAVSSPFIQEPSIQEEEVSFLFDDGDIQPLCRHHNLIYECNVVCECGHGCHEHADKEEQGSYCTACECEEFVDSIK